VVLGSDLQTGEAVKTSIGNCARCGQNHHGLPVREFTRPPKRPHGYAWFAICPVTDEPILLRIVAETPQPVAKTAAPDANQPPDPPSHGSERPKGS
jgi:hypothetical protein